MAIDRGSRLVRVTMRLLPLVGILIFTSCKKEPAVSDSSKQPAPAGNYPTVSEKALQGVVRTNFDSPNPTAAQLARRARSNKIIRDMGLPVLETLPVVEDATAVNLRTPDEVATRCLATTFCAVKGETKDQGLVDSLIKDYAASGYFSSEEKAFLANAQPTEQNLIDFCWRYECVHVFLWAMQERDGIAEPNQVCSVPEDMKLIKRAGPAKFVSGAKLRPATEILDMADLYYRLHWAAIDLRLKGKKSPKIDEEIIRERHRALNWLIRYMGQGWDDVATDT
jgi:hypothetical protein